MSVAVTSRSFSKNTILRKKLKISYPDSKFNDEGKSLDGNELINFLKGYDKAIIALEKINENVLQGLPDLKIIGKYGVGLDKIDLYAMSKYNKLLGWKPGVNKRSVSELTLNFMISSLRKLRLCQSEILNGNFYQIKGENLTNKIIGIIGCGNVGKDLVGLLKPFNCEILVNDIKDYPDFFKENNIKKCNLDYLLKNSDIITLHTPLTKTTYKFIAKKEFEIMKKSAVLINTARGGLVDERALFNSLKANRIDSAAFDVFYNEPPNNYNLLNLENFIVSPHVGGSTSDSILKMGTAAIEGLDNAQDPLNFLQYQ